jgi:cytochrome b-561 domain-containing protein 2
MSIGYLVFMSEGLIAAIYFRQIDPSPERVKAIWSHALLQLRAVVCILIGFGVIYANKIRCVRCLSARLLS